MGGKTLVYITALDPAGITAHRNMAKLLVSSLLRTRFSGDVLVFHNSARRLFGVRRAGVREVRVETPKGGPGHDFAMESYFSRYSLGERIEDVSSYEKIMYLDADVLALRNIDHLFEGEWDVAVYPEPGSQMPQPWYGSYLTDEECRRITREGLNSGTWIVAARHYRELMRRCLEIGAGAPLRGFLPEQGAFNRAVLDWPGPVHSLAPQEISMPLVSAATAHFHTYRHTALVHAAGGGSLDDKLRFLWGAYAMAFLFDPQMVLFNAMEM